MNMPFGKYKGSKVNDLPASYVIWLTSINLQEPLKSVVGKRSMDQDILEEVNKILALRSYEDLTDNLFPEYF